MKEFNQEKFDLYLSGKLSPKDKKDFDMELQNDPELQKEFRVHQEAIAISQSMGDWLTRQRIQKAETIALGKNNTGNGKRLLLLMALLLALIAALFYFWGSTETPAPSPTQIYAANYEAPRLSFGDRGSAELLSAASIAFGKKDFTSALSLFNQAAPNNEDAKVALAKGICQLELEQYSEAQQQFSQFLNDPLMGEQCRWYLALSFLKTNKPTEAIPHLEMLASNPEQYQSTAAKNILEYIK